MKTMKLILVLLVTTFAVAFCQSDKVFKEVVTFEKGFRFTATGVIQTVPYTGGATLVYWTDIIGKPATYSPAAHTHAWTEITDKPDEVELQTAISQMSVLVIPKKTTVEITAMTPAAGSFVYDVTLNVLKIGNGTVWKTLITNQ